MDNRADMTVVGEAFLKYREKGHTDSSPHAEMLDLIWKYAESDVPVLFKLADKRPFPAGRRGLKKNLGTELREIQGRAERMRKEAVGRELITQKRLLAIRRSCEGLFQAQ